MQKRKGIRLDSSDSAGEIMSNSRQWGEFSEEFPLLLQTYPDWSDRQASIRPLYAFPSSARIAEPLQHFFTDSEIDAEIEFSELCEAKGYVGMGQGVPIIHTILQPIPFITDPFESRENDPPIQSMNLNSVKREAIGHRVDGIHDRLLGYHGYLFTNPTFLTGMAELRKLYETLRFQPFPIPPPVFVQNRSELPGLKLRRKLTHDGLDEFNFSLKQFMDTWQIIQINSWDLVVSQGPLRTDLLPPNSLVTAGLKVKIAFPSYFPVTDNDQLLKEIQTTQRESEPRESSVVDLMAAHGKQFAQMARIIHLENTFRSRFPGDVPRGFTKALVEMATHYLGVRSERTVIRLRTWIKTIRSGKLNSIPELQI